MKTLGIRRARCALGLAREMRGYAGGQSNLFASSCSEVEAVMLLAPGRLSRQSHQLPICMSITSTIGPSIANRSRTAALPAWAPCS